MIIDNVNLNLLRIFECVFRTKSMTVAAKELHLTQSGVSQHMKTLEDSLEVKLFDRINQKLVPTVSGAELYKFCSLGLNQLEQALWRIRRGEKELSGVVNIGMPIEFGTNVVMPLLAQFSNQHPEVHFKIRLDFASVMNELLMKGELDYAFVDDIRMDRRVIMEKIFDERVELCVSADLMKKFGAAKNQKKYYESLHYIAYQDDEPILRNWFHHHIGNRNLHLDVRAVVMDVQGVLRLMVNGMGVAALPDYLLARAKKEGFKIYRFKGCGKPMKNTISLAYLSEKTYSPAASALLQYLQKELKTINSGNSSTS